MNTLKPLSTVEAEQLAALMRRAIANGQFSIGANDLTSDEPLDCNSTMSSDWICDSCVAVIDGDTISARPEVSLVIGQDDAEFLSKYSS